MRRSFHDSMYALVLSFALLVSGFIAFQMFRIDGLHQRLPTWDEAGHGYDSYLLFWLLSKGQVFSFLHEVIKMNYWPPGFPLFGTPFFMLFGSDFGVPRLYVMGYFLLSIPLCVVSALSLFGRKSWGAAFLLSSVVACNPLLVELSLNVMLEAPCVFLILLFCTVWELGESSEREGRKTQSARYKVLALQVATFLFFVKYNYALILMIGLLSQDIAQRFLFTGQTSVFVNAVYLKVKALLSYARRSWFWMFWLTVLCGVLLLSRAGGFDFKYGGLRFIFKGISNPLWVLLFLASLKIFIFSWRSEGRVLIRWIGELPTPWPEFFKWVFLPAAIWCLFPPSFSTFIAFISNQDTSEHMPLLSRWMFYPNVVRNVFFHDGGFTGTIVLVLIVLGIPAFFSKQCKTTIWIAYVGMLLCVSHKNLSDRYLLPLFPLLVLASYHSLLFYTSRVQCLSRELLVVVVQVFLLTFGIVFFLEQKPTEKILNQLFANRTISVERIEMVEEICRVSSKGPRSMILGYWVELSPSLIGWTCLSKNLVNDISMLPQTPIRLGLVRKAQEIDGLLKNKTIQTIIEVTYTGDKQVQYNYDTHWQRDLRLSLNRSGQFERANILDFDEGPYRLEIWKRQ